MAEHTITACLPCVEVVNTDLVVEIRADRNKIGTLTVSRGGLGWKSFRDQKERSFSWEQFDRLVLREYGER